MRKYVKGAILVVGLTFVGLQFINPAHANPQTDASLTLARTETVPPGVARTLDAACRDCHSNETAWRWYTHIAPLSWWTMSHVKAGREDLNFSVWGTYGRRFRETRLHAMCSMTKKHEMPLPSYALVHSGARLSDADIKDLCAWTEVAISRYRTGAVTPVPTPMTSSRQNAATWRLPRPALGVRLW